MGAFNTHLRVISKSFAVLIGLLIVTFICFDVETSYRILSMLPMPGIFAKQVSTNYDGNDHNLTIEPPGLFVERIAEYNAAISQVRLNIWKRRENKTWSSPRTSGLSLVSEIHDGYLWRMSQFEFVRFVGLKWHDDNQGDSSNLLLTDYYQWVADKTLCEWIRSGTGNNLPNHLFFNYTCFSNVHLSDKPNTVEKIYLNIIPEGRGKLKQNHVPEPELYNSYPSYAMYLHILQDTIVTELGNVITGSIKVRPVSCGKKKDLKTSIEEGLSNSPLYKEVIVLTQYWGKAFFHRMIETLPRLAPYQKFLADNTNIHVFVPKVDTISKKVANIFGINETRLVTGPLRAEVVYLPRGTPCGHARIQESQLMSKIYREHTEAHLNPGPRNKIVVIKRSSKRHYKQHGALVKFLQTVAGNYSLELAVWTDRPLLPFEEGMRMFHEAVMVVAPHGAGEANVIFSQPGTYVIELVCNRPHVNLCYQTSAYVLGHHYLGIPSSHGCEGVIDVELGTVKSAVLEFLNMRTNTL